MSGLVDTHAHLMDAAFDVDRDFVLQRALDGGVTGLILVGYDLASSRVAVQLARAINACATVGIHPNSVAESPKDDFSEIAELATRPEVVGIGETGLDYYRRFTPPAEQREAFEWHLALGEKLRKPVIVHNRLADADVASLVSAHRAQGVLHCFGSNDVGYLQRMLDAGFHVSLAGPLTFKNAADLRAMAAQVPVDRLLVETDCPYLAPEPHRGQRNEPAFVRHTVTCLAEIVGVSLEALTRTLWTNTLRVFPALADIKLELAR